MKVSEITVKDCLEYCRAEADVETERFLQNALTAAKSYIKSRNAIDDAYMDEHEDLTIVVYILVADMYDNRSMTVTNGKENPTATTILKLHDKNFL